MRKLTVVSFFILLLVACNTPEEMSSEEVEEVEDIEQAEVEEEEQDVAKENETEEETEEETESETEIEKKESDENADTTTEEERNEENPENEAHEEIVDVAYDIFAAQNDHDYDFLESILSDGSTLDREDNTFYFDNVKYPHEQKLLTNEDIGELELRFTNENDSGSVTVGFGAIDYENESSFVIHYEFIQDNGSWKMNDMDINK